MNQTVGKTGAAITGLAVLSFAVSMIVRLFDDSIGTFPSCLSYCNRLRRIYLLGFSG